MPFFNYKCESCEDVKEVLVKSSSVQEVNCGECETGVAKKVQSYRVNATGLPNGFSSTRNRTKTQKPIDI